MDEENEAAIQIQKYICDTYINQTFNSIQRMEKTTQQDITNSFQVYLQTNTRTKTLSKHTKITDAIIAQFTTKKEQEEKKLVSITSMLDYALEDFCETLENSPLTPCLAWLSFIVTCSECRNRNTRTKQHIGIIGLGRMGEAIVFRLLEAGHEVVCFDKNEEARKAVTVLGATVVDSIEDLAKQVHAFWLMVPAGDVVDAVIKELRPHLGAGDIIIDGGK